MHLEGSGFLLRPWRSGDEPSLVEQANDREVWINLTDSFPHPYTLEAARAWIDLAGGRDSSRTALAIEIDGAAAGGIGFTRKEGVYSRMAEIGYWLGQKYWGRGIATEAVVRVTDSGRGIPPEALPHVFDRFYRVDKARSQAEGGAGLGLAIAKWIAEGHGGSIRVDSQADRGTTFTVELPAR